MLFLAVGICHQKRGMVAWDVKQTNEACMPLTYQELKDA